MFEGNNLVFGAKAVRVRRWLVLALILSLLGGGRGWAADLLEQLQAQQIPQVLRLKVGHSRVFRPPFDITRISVANPEVVDIVLITEPRKKPGKEQILIYLMGLGTGVTNLSLWGRGRFISANVKVEPDLTLLKEKLAQILPKERIAVESAGDSIVLMGEVSGPVAQQTAISLANAFIREQSLSSQAAGQPPPGQPGSQPGGQTSAPPGGQAAGAGSGQSGGQKAFKETKVINLLHIGGVQQVLVEVRLAEINRNVAERIGVNFYGANTSGDFGVSKIGDLSTIANFARALTGISVAMSPAAPITALGGFKTGSAMWTFFFDVIKTQGLGRVLAEPNLVTTSGQEASFMAGGEFPIPVPQSGTGGGGTTITIEYKKFGVGLVFTPTVLDDGKIALKVKPEVSELDWTAGVAFIQGGYQVPGLKIRTTSTHIEVKDGQTFAISGLLSDNHRNVINKFPVLGDIPILGTLFRSSSFQKNETELVVLVTPHLVKPMTVTQARLPTDRYVEPNDFEFYLLGAQQGQRKKERPPAPVPETFPPGFGHQPVD